MNDLAKDRLPSPGNPLGLDFNTPALQRKRRLRALKPASRHYDLSLAAVTRKGRRPNLVLESFIQALAATR